MSAFNELEFVDWLRTRIPSPQSEYVGIGDDCAILDWSNKGRLLVTSDMLVEKSCFTVEGELSLQRIGRKAIAVNLSDAAAMGGRPLYALVSLGIPRGYSLQMVQALYEGMITMADLYQTKIVGGDTNVVEGPLTISVTLMADSESRKPIRRSGAGMGDHVFVTGPLGGSILGKHLDFLPRVKEGIWLSETFQITSMIDLSDGLLLDLHRICTASHLGARLFLDHIPISSAAAKAEGDKTPLERALSDGEDFELLFTCNSQTVEQLKKIAPPANFASGFRLHNIGTMIPKSLGIRGVSANGREEALEVRGFVHQ